MVGEVGMSKASYISSLLMLLNFTVLATLFAVKSDWSWFAIQILFIGLYFAQLVQGRYQK